MLTRVTVVVADGAAGHTIAHMVAVSSPASRRESIHIVPEWT